MGGGGSGGDDHDEDKMQQKLEGTLPLNAASRRQLARRPPTKPATTAPTKNQLYQLPVCAASSLSARKAPASCSTTAATLKEGACRALQGARRLFLMNLKRTARARWPSARRRVLLIEINQTWRRPAEGSGALAAIIIPPPPPPCKADNKDDWPPSRQRPRSLWRRGVAPAGRALVGTHKRAAAILRM